MTVEEIFKDEKYLGKVFEIFNNERATYDCLYPCVKEALNDILSQDNNKILISGDLGSGKTVLAICTLAYSLFELSHKTNEEVAKELGTQKKEYTIYLGLSSPVEYSMWLNIIKRLIDHFKQQDYNRFDWDRFIIVDDSEDSNILFAVISNNEISENNDNMYSFKFLNKSKLCKYILIDDKFTEFYRTNMRRDIFNESEKYSI